MHQISSIDHNVANKWKHCLSNLQNIYFLLFWQRCRSWREALQFLFRNVHFWVCTNLNIFIWIYLTISCSFDRGARVEERLCNFEKCSVLLFLNIHLHHFECIYSSLFFFTINFLLFWQKCKSWSVDAIFEKCSVSLSLNIKSCSFKSWVEIYELKSNHSRLYRKRRHLRMDFFWLEGDRWEGYLGNAWNYLEYIY